MTYSDNYYQILQVSPHVSQDMIETAYLRLLNFYPSDIYANREYIDKINEAYEVLSDPYKRNLYDDQFRPTGREEEAGAVHSLEAAYNVSADLPTVRPWVRYFARLFDFYVSTIFFFFICVTSFESYDTRLSYAVTNFIDNTPQLLSGMVLIAGWLFLEAGFLKTLATTPGKWLLGIKLQRLDGSNLPYSIGLARGFRVFVQGIGLGIPIIGLITLILSYNKLSKTGSTSWDNRYHVLVTHDKLHPLKVSLFIGLFILSVFMMG